MNAPRRRTACQPLGVSLIALIGLLSAAPLNAQAAPSPAQPQSTAQKQEIQRRVRSMARELVGGILDVQLRQLAENGLESLELYGEIRTMREHIDELIDAEMPEVVELLNRLATGPADQREQTFTLARQKSREVLVRLLVERQALLRRLRVAEMVAQVKRLIELESGILETTAALPEQVPAQREATTLATIEDQRDVKALYLGLKEMLRDASTWGGPVGAETANGLRLLETGRVDAEMDGARSHLENARFPDAVASLEAVIRGLRALLERIERAQGLVGGDVQSVRDEIRKLAERQQEVRQATAQPDLARSAMDELAQRQSEIRNDLAQMREESSTADRALEQAENAAYEATADLFEGQPEEALADQQKVLDSLAEAARQADQARPPQVANLAAEQYDKLIEDLLGARKDLVKTSKQQDAASESAQANPHEARRQEQQVARMLAEVPKDRQLPPPVTSALQEAQEAAKEAAAQMSRAEPERMEAANQAEQAIERAQSEVETALADALRHREGAKIAELAQAVWALEQAAAAERQIGEEAQNAAESQGLQEDQAGQLGERQADVQDVADNVARGVEHSAPEAAKVLNEAAAPLGQAAEQLQAAAKQPGEPSKPAAAEASRQANQAAEKLAQAADEIRNEIARAAQDLASLTHEQLGQATAARESVEEAVRNRPESMAERLERLAQAAEKVREAAADQQRAAGRPEAAQATELAAGIQRALELQNVADRAARNLTQRPDASPLDAIAKQQDVARAADRLSEQAARERSGEVSPHEESESAEPEPGDAQQPSEGDSQPADPLTEALQRAEDSAGKAAKNVLDAKRGEAEAARAETREALQEALELAEAKAEAESKSPPGEPDPASQDRVGDAVAEAQALAQPDAPQAAETLSEAGQASEQAEKALQEKADASAPQQAAAESLDQAEAQIAEAMDRLAQQAGQQFAGQSHEADQLTGQAIPVHAGATGELQSADNQAASAARQVPESPQGADPAEQGIQEAMDEAVADLLAREQELARDQALAEALAQLAARQQEAAEQLGQAAESPDQGEPTPPSPLAAALAQLEQATVQAARQLAGQNRMGNSSIEQAAALAASLAQPTEPSQASSPVATGGAAQRGQFVENPPAQPGPLQDRKPPEGIPGTPDSPNQQAETREKRFLEEPWVMQLPPEVRAAIRASVQRRPPRGYEERLEQYFRNID